MTKPISRDKVVEWLKDGILDNDKHFGHFYLLKDLLCKIVKKINSGDFDCEGSNVKQFNKDELNLLRQWFNAVHDLNEPYLDKPDYALIKKIKEFNCEAVKSEWKPGIGEAYSFVWFSGWKWNITNTEWDDDVYDKVRLKMKNVFKTEQSCKKYMNAKGWINDNKEWEI